MGAIEGRRVLGAAAVCCALLAPAAARANSTVIATLSAESPISAGEGWLIWSVPSGTGWALEGLHHGRLWTIDASALQDFLYACPEYGCAALLGIDIILSRRLRRTNEVIRQNEIVPGFLSVRAKRRAATASLR